MAKRALLIGVSDYEPGLEALPAAVQDVLAMQHVLTHPEIGGFEPDHVSVLQNPERQRMEDAIYALFADRQKTDLLLLYFSGHGVLADNGEFYLTSRLTRKEGGRLVLPTAVAARSVQDWMGQSRAQRKVIILDSCYSGAFAKGVQAKDSGSLNPEQFLGEKGTAILTASTSSQYALTQTGFELSIYTHYLVEGLRTGGADQDDDGMISAEELHRYASAKVQEAAPAMTPEFYPVRDGSKILLAKSPQDDPMLKYRKAVKQLAEEDEGDFSVINRAFLNNLQRSLGLSSDAITTIETEELEPYRQRQAKIEQYRDVFSREVAANYPLSDRDRNALKRFQAQLSLRDEDIAAIEAPILAPKQIAYDRQQAEQRQRERVQAAQSSQPIPVSQTKETSSEISTTSFEFETATVSIVKQPGWFGSKNIVEINRRRGRAEYFAENLGSSITLEMVKIPGGSFMMGSPDIELERYSDESPQHPVTVPSFFMGKFAITQAQYKAVMGSNPANFKGANRPVEQVSWNDAVEFCRKLSEQTEYTYRLPSEAEWEYASRAGTTTPFYFGETITPDLANYNGNYAYGEGVKGIYRGQTTDIGAFPPNAFGLHEMYGNVWEWCEDCWHKNYEGAPNDGRAWVTDGNSEKRVLRGGSWDYNPRNCRSAARDHVVAGIRVNHIGFRVVCSASRTL